MTVHDDGGGEPQADPDPGEPAELVLECYNDPGKNTISDWLYWRDLSIRNP